MTVSVGRRENARGADATPFHEVGARFSPLRTILLVSEVGRRQRRRDLAQQRGVDRVCGCAFHGVRLMRLPPSPGSPSP